MRDTGPIIPVPSPVEYVDSIAVMPLENRTGDASLDHVGLGITEEIITYLARIPPLKVISRHSVQAISRQNLTYPQLGSLLKVRHIVEGSVTSKDGQIIVSLNHINAANNAMIWSEDLTITHNDPIDARADIAVAVMHRVVETIPGLPLPDTADATDLGPGQEAYLEGTRWLGQRTATALAQAITAFSTAIELDPGFAPAYADLSSAYALAVFYRYDIGGTDSYQLAARSLALAERALALEPDLAAGFASRGYLGALIGMSAEDVAADFDRAIDLQPNAASIPSWRARSLAQLGDVEEAFSEASRAVDLDPLAPGRHIALAELSLQLGRYEQAIESARSAYSLEPAIIRSRAIEARALLLSGDPELCAELPLGPHRVLRATCLEAAGQSEEAADIVAAVLSDIRADRQLDETYTDVIAFEDLAVDFAMRGDASNAMFWAARAYSASPVGLEVRILESALFDMVRDDPEFKRSIDSIRSDLVARVRRDSERIR